MLLDIAKHIGTINVQNGKANGRQMNEQLELKKYEVYFRFNDFEITSITVAGDLFFFSDGLLTIVAGNQQRPVAAFPVDMVLAIVERDDRQ